MKKHLKDNWTFYIYLLWQIPQAILWYKGIIHWKWIYVWMPSLILLTIILMTLILGYYCGIKDNDFDRNSYRYK
jgi:hypothetical protein